MIDLTFPWKQAGGLLRRLSLSGGAGNGIAWILFLAAGALPLFAAFYLWRRRRAVKADLLLVSSSAAIWAGLWFFINPTYMNRYLSPIPSGGMAKYALAAVMDSLLLTWILLRCILCCGKLEQGGILSGLRVLLGVYIGLSAGNLLWQAVTQTAREYTALKDGNTGVSHALLSFSVFFLILQTIVGILPEFCNLALLVLVSGFLGSYKKGAYSEASCLWMKRLGTASGHFLTLILSVTVGFNVLQLLCSRFILSSHHRIFFPLSGLLVVLGIRMFSFLYLDGKQMKEDNEMFI